MSTTFTSWMDPPRPISVLIDNNAKTIISKDFSGRGIATKTGETRYTNFSTYASSNFGTTEYTTAWFMAA